MEKINSTRRMSERTQERGSLTPGAVSAADCPGGIETRDLHPLASGPVPKLMATPIRLLTRAKLVLLHETQRKGASITHKTPGHLRSPNPEAPPLRLLHFPGGARAATAWATAAEVGPRAAPGAHPRRGLPPSGAASTRRVHLGAPPHSPARVAQAPPLVASEQLKPASAPEKRESGGTRNSCCRALGVTPAQGRAEAGRRGGDHATFRGRLDESGAL